VYISSSGQITEWYKNCTITPTPTPTPTVTPTPSAVNVVGLNITPNVNLDGSVDINGSIEFNVIPTALINFDINWAITIDPYNQFPNPITGTSSFSAGPGGTALVGFNITSVGYSQDGNATTDSVCISSITNAIATGFTC
jgi:hypothetical protein